MPLPSGNASSHLWPTKGGENQEGGREDGVRGQCGEDEKRKE